MGHSQEYIAGKSGITREYLGKIERDGAKDKVTISTLTRIASALGKKVMVIFYE